MKEKTLRVLLVEDDEEDFLIARDLFEEIQHHRYELDWIEFYDEAIEEIERQRHDIYLLDYHLGASRTAGGQRSTFPDILANVYRDPNTVERKH